MKLDLLTNATVVDDAIRFVSSDDRSKDKENLKSSSSKSIEDEKQESKEPDYHEDEELEENQEEETGEITTNQVF